MSTIEAIKTAGVAYQATTANTVVKEVSQSRDTVVDNQATAAKVAASTTDFTVKEMSKDGTEDKNESQNQGHGSPNSNLEAMKKAVAEINKNTDNSTVQFGIHEATNRMTIKIMDKDTKKVIKEFPAEKTLDLIAKAWEMAGIMVDEKR